MGRRFRRLHAATPSILAQSFLAVAAGAAIVAFLVLAVQSASAQTLERTAASGVVKTGYREGAPARDRLAVESISTANCGGGKIP